MKKAILSVLLMALTGVAMAETDLTLYSLVFHKADSRCKIEVVTEYNPIHIKDELTMRANYIQFIVDGNIVWENDRYNYIFHKKVDDIKTDIVSGGNTLGNSKFNREDIKKLASDYRCEDK